MDIDNKKQNDTSTDLSVSKAPSYEAQRIAGWILARAREQNDEINSVLWLACQLENINQGRLIEPKSLETIL